MVWKRLHEHFLGRVDDHMYAPPVELCHDARIDVLRRSLGDTARKDDEVAFLHVGELLEELVERLVVDGSAARVHRGFDVVIGTCRRALQLGVDAGVALRQMNETRGDAVFLQCSLERRAGPSGHETPCRAGAAQVAQDVRDVHALPAEIELLRERPVDFSDLQVLNLHDAVNRGIECDGIDHGATLPQLGIPLHHTL